MYRILELNPQLKNFEHDIQLRMDLYHNTKKRLLGDGKSLKEFANAHHYFGIHHLNGSWVYREWAPSAYQLYLMGDFNNSVQSPLCQEIRKNSYIDLWAEMNNYTYDSRIDFIYGTDAMRKALKACYMPMDFARQEHILTSVNGVALNGGSGLWKYSDHYPVVAEFSLYEE